MFVGIQKHTCGVPSPGRCEFDEVVSSVVLTASNGFDFAALPALAQDVLACMTAMQPLALDDPGLEGKVSTCDCANVNAK